MWVFGAGDDAQPLLELAKNLGWFCVLADGRAHLVTRERFPRADGLYHLPVKELPANHAAGRPSALAGLQPQDAAVVMTHSFEQDSRVLASLRTIEVPLAYVGVLGPQRRTRELLIEAARLLDLPAVSSEALVEGWLAELHAPTGLDLGRESPEIIALSIVAEIQQCFAHTTGLPLREVRPALAAISN